MTNRTIIEIDNILISSAIFTEHFTCDISKCHGACCIIGDSGAPLTGQECTTLTKEFNSISNYLRKEGINSIKKQGLFVRDLDQDLVTPLIKGEECAYTIFDENHNCFCGIETAHRDGNSTMKKPISCWLYPIRVSYLSNGLIALNLHEWNICLDAYAKGKKEGIPVFRFLKEPLIFSFGKDFYIQLEKAYEQICSG
ncbi:MAG: DUF3109 family protein [Bacteroidales bacterium]